MMKQQQMINATTKEIEVEIYTKCERKEKVEENNYRTLAQK